MRLKLTSTTKANKIARIVLERLKDVNIKSTVSNEINNKLRSLSKSKNNIFEQWKETSKSMNEISINILGKKREIAKQKWMTSKILMLMETRRQHRNRNQTEYNRLQREIRLKCREAKKYGDQCNELEHLQHLHDDFNLHKKVKELSGNLKKCVSSYLTNNLVLNMGKLHDRTAWRRRKKS